MSDEIPLLQKDPNAIVDYGVDLAPGVFGQDNYLEDGETISTSTWTLTEGDNALILSTPSIIGGTRTRVVAEGGTLGTFYTMTNRFTTSLGRTDDRSIRLVIQQK